MFKWLLGLAGLGAVVAIAASSKAAPTPAAPTQQTQLLQFQALFKVTLQNDLAAGGTPLPANVSVDALASTYAQVYLIGTKEQLASAVADANARKYSQTAGLLAQRPSS